MAEHHETEGEFKEILVTDRGDTIFVKPSVAGGRIYMSDECGIGLHYIDTTLCSLEIMEQIIAYERNLQKEELNREGISNG